MRKMNPEDKKTNITICLSKEAIKRLGMVSDINNRSKSSMIETLINQEYYSVLENEELYNDKWKFLPK